MILDPDYARIYTQARVSAWQYGWAIALHGSGSRDLDLLLVPWIEKPGAGHEHVVKWIAMNTGTKLVGEPSQRPHGRLTYTLHLPDDVRWVDLSVMPMTPRCPP